MQAARIGQVGIAQLLLDRGARIQASDDLWQVPLSEAAKYGQTKIVHLHLARGAKLDNIHGCGSPLVHAAIGGHRPLVDLLLARGARRGLLDALTLGDRSFFETILDERLAAQAEEDGPDEPADDEDVRESAWLYRRCLAVDRLYAPPDRLAKIAARLGQLGRVWQ